MRLHRLANFCKISIASDHDHIGNHVKLRDSRHGFFEVRFCLLWMSPTIGIGEAHIARFWNVSQNFGSKLVLFYYLQIPLSGLFFIFTSLIYDISVIVHLFSLFNE